MRQLGAPPLSEGEVAEAEAQIGITFPAEYRAYLLEVSADGAVNRLVRNEQGWGWAGNDDSRRLLLRTPFPHPASYVEAEEQLDAREPQPGAFSDEQSYAEAWQAWDAEYAVFQDWKTAGSIIAQDHGCGFATLLALTGPLAGTLWWDGRATCGLILPLSLDHDNGSPPVTFTQWLTRDSWNLLPPGWGQRAGTPQ
ncbi:SMI1/KNR4 family protein [Microbispora sp. GKU 823]|uniref:SMI1/KNR4 family protein n=1 Tax=Microbispora sp. GKU 823 TaxID=1652100 RepID=UPI0009C5F4DB|nr:SMI1/KNR4 family protein [Microbispora sp. GKU 823]OPG13231.1 SMI1/KNR4 family protein [Microbispora sp. GKU 823]